MNVVDTSGWLEYFEGSDRAELFADAIEHTDELIVSTVSLYEVFKWVFRYRNEQSALMAVAAMQQGRVVAVDATLALEAAKLSATRKLPMADSLIYATARHHGATLWTQDDDFEGLEGVNYFRKKLN